MENSDKTRTISQSWGSSRIVVMAKPMKSLENFGGADGDRTHDL